MSKFTTADYLTFLRDEYNREPRPELEDMETIIDADVGIVNEDDGKPQYIECDRKYSEKILARKKGSSRHPVDTWSTDPDGARKHAERHAIDHGPTNHRGEYVDCLDWSD